MTGDPNPYKWWCQYQSHCAYKNTSTFYSSPELKREVNQEKRIIVANNGYIVAWDGEFLGKINTYYRIFSTLEEMQVWLKKVLE
jgi:hypothetical protein